MREAYYCIGVREGTRSHTCACDQFDISLLEDRIGKYHVARIPRWRDMNKWTSEHTWGDVQDERTLYAA